MSRPPKAPQDRATCALTLRMTLRDARALRAWAKARGKALAPLLVQAGLREADWSPSFFTSPPEEVKS